MLRGQKETARNIVYEAFEEIKEKAKTENPYGSF
jgi:ribosomal protein S7